MKEEHKPMEKEYKPKYEEYMRKCSPERRVEVLKESFNQPLPLKTLELPKLNISIEKLESRDISKQRFPILIEGFKGRGKSTYVLDLLQSYKEKGNPVHYCLISKTEDTESSMISSLFGFSEAMNRIDQSEFTLKGIHKYLELWKNDPKWKKPILVIDNAQLLLNAPYCNDFLRSLLPLNVDGTLQIIFFTSEGSMEGPLCADCGYGSRLTKFRFDSVTDEIVLEYLKSDALKPYIEKACWSDFEIQKFVDYFNGELLHLSACLIDDVKLDTVIDLQTQITQTSLSSLTNVEKQEAAIFLQQLLRGNIKERGPVGNIEIAKKLIRLNILGNNAQEVLRKYIYTGMS